MIGRRSHRTAREVVRDPGDEQGLIAIVQGAVTTSAFSMDDGAPEWLHTSADAAWRGQPTPPADVLGIIVTLNRAAIYHSVKKVSLILNSSHEIESIGSGKGAEVNTIAREIMRAHGKPMLTPTEILCDNQAHVSLANKRETRSQDGQRSQGGAAESIWSSGVNAEQLRQAEQRIQGGAVGAAEPRRSS